MVSPTRSALVSVVVDGAGTRTHNQPSNDPQNSCVVCLSNLSPTRERSLSNKSTSAAPYLHTTIHHSVTNDVPSCAPKPPTQAIVAACSKEAKPVSGISPPAARAGMTPNVSPLLVPYLSHNPQE